MRFNLAPLPKEDKEKINADLAAAGVAFKERYHLPVNAEAVKCEQPESLHQWFHQRLTHFRQISDTLSRLPVEPNKK